MENICHTLVGGALARSGFDRYTPLALPALLVSANFPDIDTVSFLAGDLTYLEHHRGLTHSILGLAVSALGLAAFFWTVGRFLKSRDPEREQVRFVRILVVCSAGLASHFLLDWTNSYGVKPWLPFDATWFYGDLVFIVDPWLWLILAGSLWLGTESRKGSVAWSAFLLFLAAAVYVGGFLAPDRAGVWPVVVWALMVCVLVAIWLTRRYSGSVLPARVALGAVVVYWAALAVVHSIAMSKVPVLAPNGESGTVVVVPTLMRPDRWRATLVTQEALYSDDVSVFGPQLTNFASRTDRHLDDAEARAAATTCAGQTALAFSRFLYAEIAKNPDGSSTVTFQDSRFTSLRRAYSFSSVPVRLDRQMNPEPDKRLCPKFGGS